MRGNVVTLFRRYPNSVFIDFTQSVSPTRAIPYATGETYRFTRESTVWCQAYDTDTQALKWVEIPANIPLMPGMRWDAVNSLWSPYDDNGVLIPAAFRKGYWYLPQATNSVAYSRDFTATGWGKISNTAPTLTQTATGFDGAVNKAWTMTTSGANSSDSQGWAFMLGPQPVGTHLGCIRVKKEAISRTVALRLRSSDNVNDSWLYLDVKDGTTLVSASVTTYGVADDGDWWVPWVCTTTTDPTKAVHLSFTVSMLQAP
jgi:hypothetical protein